MGKETTTKEETSFEMDHITGEPGRTTVDAQKLDRKFKEIKKELKELKDALTASR